MDIVFWFGVCCLFVAFSGAVAMRFLPKVIKPTKIIEMPSRYLLMIYLLMAVSVIGSLAMMLTGGADTSFVLGNFKLQVTWMGWRFMAMLALFFPLHIYTCKNTKWRKEVISPSFVFFIIALLISAVSYHIYAFVRWDYDIAYALRSILLPAMLFWCIYNILYLPLIFAFRVVCGNDGEDGGSGEGK